MAAQGQLTLGNEVLHYNAVGERLLARSNLPIVLQAVGAVYPHARTEAEGTSIASHYVPDLLELGTGILPGGDLEEALELILTRNPTSGDNIDGALVMDGSSYKSRMFMFNTNPSHYFHNVRKIEGTIRPRKLGLNGEEIGSRHLNSISVSADYANVYPDSYVLVLSSSGSVRVFQDGYAALSLNENELARPSADIITCDEFLRRRHSGPQPPPPVAGAARPLAYTASPA